LKEFDPILLKLLFKEYKIVSIAVKIPTRAVIPTIIIKMVSKDLNKLDFIELSAIFIFSNNNIL